MVLADRAYLGLQCKGSWMQSQACHVCYLVHSYQARFLLVAICQWTSYNICNTTQFYPLHLASFKPLHSGQSGDRDNWILQRGGHLGVRGDIQFFWQVKQYYYYFFLKKRFILHNMQCNQSESIIQKPNRNRDQRFSMQIKFHDFLQDKRRFVIH